MWFAPLRIDNANYAQLGFLDVSLQTGIRLIAEERVLLLVHQDLESVRRHRARLGAL